MELGILGVASAIFVGFLICTSFAGVVHLGKNIVVACKTVDTKLGEQRIRDITAEDLGYSIPFSNVPVPDISCHEKKEVIPVKEERPQEFTGIRAIQL